MLLPTRFAAMTLLFAVLAALAPARADAQDDTRNAAVQFARKTAADARKAAKGDAATLKLLKEARTGMEPFFPDVRAGHWGSAKGSRSESFAAAWNELATVCAFHGMAGKAGYVLDKNEVLWNRYLLGLPAGMRWSWRVNTDPKNNDQLNMYVEQERPNKQKLRVIKVWTYRWDTVYSGVGGENYKGLAKMMHEVDRDSTAKSGRKSSTSITTRRINSEFDRVYYYFVEGLDVDEEKRLRRDNYYMKGLNLSFNFEVITYMDPTEGDDEVTKWQATDADPEIAAVLESLVNNPAYKPPK